MIQIGKYTPASARCPAQIQREFYGQGYIVKDEPAFLSQPDRVCYVPELSDTLLYTPGFPAHLQRAAGAGTNML